MPKSKKVKPISFRVYPDGRFLYAEVNIWPTKKAMQAHVKLPGRKYEASCGGRESYIVPPKGKGRMRKTGLFAEANFHNRAIGVEVVSHEFTHAAFAFADRRKLNLSDVVAKTWSQEGRKSTWILIATRSDSVTRSGRWSDSLRRSVTTLDYTAT